MATACSNANTPIKNIILENLNDDKTLKKEIVKQIYTHAEKKVVLVHNFAISENYLICKLSNFPNTHVTPNKRYGM